MTEKRERVQLVTFSRKTGGLRVVSKHEEVEHLLYSIDELQVEAIRVYRKDYAESDCPPETITATNSSLELRPLYFDVKFGHVRRAIPLTWNEGVPYK